MQSPKNDQPLFNSTQPDIDRDVSAFLIDRQASGCSPKTIKGYQDELGRLVDCLSQQGIGTTEKITAHHLRQFFLALADL